MKIFLYPFLIGALMIATHGVWAADPPQRTLEECKKVFESCYAGCRKKHPEQDLSGDAARTACGSTCAAQRTACQAAIEYEKKAKPMLEKMIDDLKKFLDDLIENFPRTKPAPAPKPDDGPVKT